MLPTAIDPQTEQGNRTQNNNQPSTFRSQGNNRKQPTVNDHDEPLQAKAPQTLSLPLGATSRTLQTVQRCNAVKSTESNRRWPVKHRPTGNCPAENMQSKSPEPLLVSQNQNPTQPIKCENQTRRSPFERSPDFPSIQPKSCSPR